MTIANTLQSIATAPAPSREPRRTPLTPVKAQPRRRPSTLHAATAVAALVAVVVAQLLLSIALTQGAYQMEQLELQSKDLQRDLQQATVHVQQASSPQNLAAKAAALGMVNDSSPVYLRLSDGAVLGAPSAVGGAVPSSSLVPNATVTPPAAAAPVATEGAVAGESGAATPAPNRELVPWQGALPAPATH